MSRLENTTKNAAWQLASAIALIAINLINRYCFMYILGETYLGLSTLFTSILSVLSFMDLGIANCFTFCFYKPIAEKNEQYLKVLLKAFQRVMRIIMLAILILGLSLLPFLRLLANGGESISDATLRICYLLSLLDVLASYFCTYKVCYVAAEQKEYQLMPFRICGSFLTALLKLAVLLLTQNYALYIAAGVAVTLIQQGVITAYIAHKYPITRELDIKGRLVEEDKASIKRNLKGMLLSKFAQISVNQTDSILVSAGLNVGLLGLVGNYQALKGNVFSLVSEVQKSAVASMGNLIASNPPKKQLDVFYTYMMLNELVIGVSVCGLATLMTPFITLIFGASKTVGTETVMLICISSGIAYQTYGLNILPTAGGRYDLGVWVTFLEGASNLIVSIVAMKYMGLVGVYVGTLVSQLLTYFLKPFYVFPEMYSMTPVRYFVRTGLGMATIGVGLAINHLTAQIVFCHGITWISFLLMAVITVIEFLLLFFVLWHRDQYFKDMIRNIKRIICYFINKKT